MTTATKAASVSAELRKLEQRRDKAHQKTREARDVRDAWEQETQIKDAELGLRTQSHPDEFEGPTKVPKPDTPAGKLYAEIRERREQPNPRQAAYEDARAAFHEQDEEVSAFKVAHVHDRLAEVNPDIEAAVEQMRSGDEQRLRGCERYRAGREEQRAIIADTPGLERGPHSFIAFDPRVDEWYREAREALDSDVIAPGLSDHAIARLEQLHG